LRLDYTRLKKQLGGVPTRRRKRATKPAFVELIAPGCTTPEEYGIEFESCGGNKMRIQWKSTAPPDWTNLLRAAHLPRVVVQQLDGGASLSRL
jgi:hypothetical protein